MKLLYMITAKNNNYFIKVYFATAWSAKFILRVDWSAKFILLPDFSEKFILHSKTSQNKFCTPRHRKLDELFLLNAPHYALFVYWPVIRCTRTVITDN
ncbi:hypothetical protein BGS_0601 [Beggiatoa sp. SS]|nr:hypothetical protein BGS_0601 [Beggiatoa sp. SS]